MAFLIGNLSSQLDNGDHPLITLKTRVNNALQLLGINIDFKNPESIQQAVSQLMKSSPQLGLALAAFYAEIKLDTIRAAYEIKKGERVDRVDEGEEISEEERERMQKIRTTRVRFIINVATGEVKQVEEPLTDREIEKQAADSGLRRPHPLSEFPIIGLLFRRRYSGAEVREMLKRLIPEGEFVIELGCLSDNLDNIQKQILQQLGLLEGDDRFDLIQNPEKAELVLSQILEVQALRGEYLRLTGLPQHQIAEVFFNPSSNTRLDQFISQVKDGALVGQILDQIRGSIKDKFEEERRGRRERQIRERLEERKRKLEEALTKAKKREEEEEKKSKKGQLSEDEELRVRVINKSLEEQLRLLTYISGETGLTIDDFLEKGNIVSLRRRRRELEREIEHRQELQKRLDWLIGQREKKSQDFTSLSERRVRETTREGKVTEYAQLEEIKKRLESLNKELDDIEREIRDINEQIKRLEGKKIELGLITEKITSYEEALTQQITIDGETKTVKEWIDEYRRLEREQQFREEKSQDEGQERSSSEIERDLIVVKVLLGYYSEESLTARRQRQASGQYFRDFQADEKILRAMNPGLKKLLIKSGILQVDTDGKIAVETDKTNVTNVIRSLYLVFGPDFVEGSLDSSQVSEYGLTVEEINRFLGSLDLSRITNEQLLEEVLDKFLVKVDMGEDFL